MEYFVGKNHCFAINVKAKSNSIAYALVQKDYQDRIENLGNLEDVQDWEWQTIIPATEAPQKPVLIGISEPIQRFVKGVSMSQLDVEEILASLEAGGQWITYPLFLKQVQFKNDNHGQEVTFFKVDTDKGWLDFCTLAGFNHETPYMNQLKNNKFILTPEQEKRVSDYYQDDIEFYENTL